MAGVGGEDGGDSAGHGFHGDEIGAAFAAIGEEGDVGFAHEGGELGLDEASQVDEVGEILFFEPGGESVSPRCRRWVALTKPAVSISLMLWGQALCQAKMRMVSG